MKVVLPGESFSAIQTQRGVLPSWNTLPHSRQDVRHQLKPERQTGALLPRLLLMPVLSLLVCLSVLLAVPSGASAQPQIGLMVGGSYPQIASDMDAIAHSGARILRVELNWKAGWAGYDTTFQLAAERGITILPYLYGNGASHGYPAKAEYPAWEQWVYEVVHRYGYGGDFWAAHPGLTADPAHAWEVWNEPNLGQNNPGETTVQPANYAAFLKRTSQAIHAAQAERSATPTEVLFGGLISVNSGGSSMAVKQFLEQVHATGETNTAFEGLSLHPYSLTGGVAGVEGNISAARTALTSIYGASKSIWITELGWPVEYGSPSVSESEQASLLTASFNMIKNRSAEWGIQSVLWYFYRDLNVASWQYHTGLRAESGRFRQSWFAFQVEAGAPEWPIAGWYTENLGGNILSAPAISSWGVNRADVFAQGTDNSLDHKFWTPGTQWTAWERIGIGPSINSAPSAVSWGPGRIDVVARIADGSVQHWSYAGPWYTENLGGNILSAPAISSWGVNRADVFAQGTDNSLDHKFWTPGTQWTAWERIGIGPSLNSAPSAVSPAPGRMDVVARIADGSVQHWTYLGPWYTENLGGNILSAPAISSWGVTRFDAFAQGTDNSLDHKWWTPETGWTAWERVPGPAITSAPSAVSWGHGRIDVVARIADGSVQHWSWQGNQ